MSPEVALILISELPVAELLLHSTMTLATADQGGEPHAAAVYFAADGDLNFYFFSGSHSQHGQDLSFRPTCAIAIYPECHDWQEIRGLQLRGEASPVLPGPVWDYAWSVYQAKFPFVSEMRELVARNHFYIFVPAWVRLVDNRRGFGFKQEWRRVLQEGDIKKPASWQAVDDTGAETGAPYGGA